MKTIHLLTEAKFEIERLRRQNEILSAKVEVMDLFACVLHTHPASRVESMGVDLVWQLVQEIERLKNPPIMPACPACKTNLQVTLSPEESAFRGEFFCPCNEPGSTRDGGHFNSDEAFTG